MAPVFVKLRVFLLRVGLPPVTDKDNVDVRLREPDIDNVSDALAVGDKLSDADTVVDVVGDALTVPVRPDEGDRERVSVDGGVMVIDRVSDVEDEVLCVKVYVIEGVADSDSDFESVSDPLPELDTVALPVRDGDCDNDSEVEWLWESDVDSDKLLELDRDVDSDSVELCVVDGVLRENVPALRLAVG